MTGETRAPKTRKECFDILDRMLAKEDRESIAQMEGVDGLHFTLGLWIRNNWIYRQSEKETKRLLKDFRKDEDDLFFTHPDDFSSTILKSYQTYLKQEHIDL